MRVALQVEYRLLIAVGDDEPIPIVLTRDALMDLRQQIDELLGTSAVQTIVTQNARYPGPEAFRDDPRPSAGVWTREDDEALVNMISHERPPDVVAGLLGRSAREIMDRYHQLTEGA